MEITRYNDGCIGIDYVPERSRIALYIRRGCNIHHAAYFANDDDAEFVKAFLIKMADRANEANRIKDEADKAAREECAEICREQGRLLYDHGQKPGADCCAEAIEETIK